MPRNGADRRLAAAGLTLLLTLSACGTAPPPAPQAPERSPESAVTVTPLAPEPAPAEPQPSFNPPAQEASAAPVPEEKPINDDPNQLLKLSGMRVAALLGPASYVRRDGPAEVWQYRADHCVLDVFLYKDGEDLSVAYVNLRKRSDTSVPARRCFANLLLSRR
jgi:hypothetical protein